MGNVTFWQRGAQLIDIFSPKCILVTVQGIEMQVDFLPARYVFFISFIAIYTFQKTIIYYFICFFFDKSKNLHVWICTADIPTISYKAHGYILQLMMNLHFWLSHIYCISNTRTIWLDSLDCDSILDSIIFVMPKNE